MSRKQTKRKKKHLQATPHQNRGEQNAGANMDVSGRVEISRAPSLEEQYKAERKEDKCQQEKDYRVAKWTLAFVIVYSFLTLLMYLANQKAANAAKSAADTAQHTLIAMQTSSRPWLTLEKVTVGKTLGDEGQQTTTKTQAGIVDIWQFSFDLTNYGHLPASEVESTAIIMHGFGAQFIWRAQAVCPDALPPPTPQKIWTAYPNRPKDVVFPNNPVPRQNGAMSIAGIEDPQTDVGQRYLVVCLSYRDDSVGEMHHTKLLYHGEAVKWKPVLVNGLTYYPIETLQLRGTAAE